MAEEAAETETTTTETTTTAATETDDQRVPYERFQKANQKAKEAAERATTLEREMAELRQQVEERESAGMPELDQLKKRLETAEKARQAAESKAEETERNLHRSQRERWVTQAASKQNFIDPDDAARYVDLDDIEDADQAERAVKRVAKAKEHLVRTEERKLPGQVLENGRRSQAAKPATGGIDTNAEAESIAAALKQFTQNWHTIG